jgi:hypothetical protein
MRRFLISAVVVASVVAPLPAMSADTGPLPPGRPAGVKQAQAQNAPPLVWLVGAGVVIGVGILILANNNGGASGPRPVCCGPISTTTTS